MEKDFDLEKLREILLPFAPKTKEQLNVYLKEIFGFYLASKPILEGNSCPLDFVWDVYSSALGLKENPTIEDFSFLGMASRGSMKTLSTAAIEILLLCFDKDRDCFHMASIYEQSRVAYDYVTGIFSKPKMKRFIKNTTMKRTESTSGRILKIGTGTMDSVNSFHGCIAHSQRVGVPSGFLKLNDIFNHLKRKPSVIESDFGLRDVVAWKDSGVQECIKIATESGRELICTPNHMVKCYDSSKNEFRFKKANELCVDDYLLIRHSEKFSKENFPNNRFKKFLPKTRKSKDDFCYLVGRAIGDACLTVKNRITITTGIKEDAIYLKNIIYSIYPNANPMISTKESIKLGSENYNVILQLKEIKDLWRDCGISFVLAKEKSVPDFIFSESKHFFYKFLSGYWDADGTARLRQGNFGEGAEVSFCSTSMQLLQEIQMFLTRDRIQSKIRKNLRQNPFKLEEEILPCYYLDIYSSSAIRLAKKISSFLPESSDKFKRLKQIQVLEDYFTHEKWPVCIIDLMRDVMSTYHSLVKRGWAEPKFDGYCISGRKDSFTTKTIKRFLSETIECSFTKSWKTLNEMVTLPIWPDKFKEKISSFGAFKTYDVQVADREVWCPNNFVVHNSVIQDEVDLTDKKVFDESNGMLSPGINSAPPLDIKISSRKFAIGNIQSLLDSKASNPDFPIKIHTWGLMEMMEKCTPERSGGDKLTETLWVDNQNLHVLTEEEMRKPENAKVSSNYLAYPAYKNCYSCGIFSFCKGNAKKQVDKSENPFLTSVEIVRSYFLKEDTEFFKSQRLNMKPSSSGLIYPSFSRDVHVLDEKRMWKAFFADEYTKEQVLTFDAFILEMLKMGCEAYIGADYGYNYAAAVLIIKAGDKFFVMDELAVHGKTDEEFACLAFERWGWIKKFEGGFGDVASPGAQKEFSRYFPMLTRDQGAGEQFGEYARLSKNYTYKFGEIRKLLATPATRETKLYIANRCSVLAEQMAIYRSHITKGESYSIDVPASGQIDHEIDAMTHGIVGILVAGALGVQVNVVDIGNASKGNFLNLPNMGDYEVPQVSVAIDAATGKPLVQNPSDKKDDGLVLIF